MLVFASGRDPDARATEPRTASLAGSERQFVLYERVTREELDGIRRSLAIGNGLPPSQITLVIDLCERLLVERERIEAILRQLGPAWTDTRAALNELHAVLRGHG